MPYPISIRKRNFLQRTLPEKTIDSLQCQARKGSLPFYARIFSPILYSSEPEKKIDLLMKMVPRRVAQDLDSYHICSDAKNEFSLKLFILDKNCLSNEQYFRLAKYLYKVDRQLFLNNIEHFFSFLDNPQRQELLKLYFFNELINLFNIVPTNEEEIINTIFKIIRIIDQFNLPDDVLNDLNNILDKNKSQHMFNLFLFKIARESLIPSFSKKILIKLLKFFPYHNFNIIFSILPELSEKFDNLTELELAYMHSFKILGINKEYRERYGDKQEEYVKWFKETTLKALFQLKRDSKTDFISLAKFVGYERNARAFKVAERIPKINFLSCEDAKFFEVPGFGMLACDLNSKKNNFVTLLPSGMLDANICPGEAVFARFNNFTEDDPFVEPKTKMSIHVLKRCTDTAVVIGHKPSIESINSLKEYWDLAMQRCDDIEIIHEKIATFIFYFTLVCPFLRGSASICEILTDTLWLYHGYLPPSQEENDLSIDLKVFMYADNLKEFINFVPYGKKI